MHQYRSQFQAVNGANLSLLIESYNQRTDLGIQRPAPAGKQVSHGGETGQSRRGNGSVNGSVTAGKRIC